jgi:hypothetical protein
MGKGEEGKDYSLHLFALRFHHPVAQVIGRKQSRYKWQCQKKSPWEKDGNGRERPHFLAVKPPKISWGHSRPSRRKRDRVLAACRRQSKHFVMQAAMQLA